MWETLSKPWQACLEEAWAAYCAGTAPIGAVIADGDGVVLARDRNHIYEDYGFPAGFVNHKLRHAEMMVLMKINLRFEARRQAILYTSLEPCPLCFGAFYMSGLRQLRYAARDPYAGSTNLLGTTEYFKRKQITLGGPLAEFEASLHGLAIEFHTRTHGGLKGAQKAQYQDVLPEHLAFGEMLHNEGEINAMRQQAVPVEEAFAWLQGRFAGN